MQTAISHGMTHSLTHSLTNTHDDYCMPLGLRSLRYSKKTVFRESGLQRLAALTRQDTALTISSFIHASFISGKDIHVQLIECSSVTRQKKRRRQKEVPVQREVPVDV